METTTTCWQKIETIQILPLQSNQWQQQEWYRYIGIAYAVKEQVDENKGNRRILAQATVEANDKIDLLERQTARLYAALMAKREDTTAVPQQSKHWLIESIALKVEVEEKEAKVKKEEDNTQNTGQQQLPQMKQWWRN